mgnify:CR=1 FL=1
MSKLFRTTLWILSGIGLIAFLVQTLSTFLISPLMGLLSLLIAAVLVALVIFLPHGIVGSFLAWRARRAAIMTSSKRLSMTWRQSSTVMRAINLLAAGRPSMR